jgi:hypothetical protein
VSIPRPTRRRIGARDLPAALSAVADWLGDEPPASQPDRSLVAAGVRSSLRALAAEAPGRTVEVRVPPFGAVQCIAQPDDGRSADRGHSRGTPPNVVQTDARTWLRLVVGACSWDEAVASGRVEVSGTRAAEIASHLPLAR